MKTAVIYDFHGTLVDVESVLHHLDDRDFDSFYADSLGCPPHESTVMAARQSYQAGHVNLLFTGMPDKYCHGLNAWLIRHEVPIHTVSMRSAADGFKKSFIVKRRMLLEAIDLGYYVVRAWEDSPADCDLWEKQGIPVTRVPRRQDAAK